MMLMIIIIMIRPVPRRAPRGAHRSRRGPALRRGLIIARIMMILMIMVISNSNSNSNSSNDNDDDHMISSV